MLESIFIVVICVFTLTTISAIIVWTERIYISIIRRQYINRIRNRFDGLIFVYFRNNIVDIDTGTETCTEVDDSEHKENANENILYANGIIDIETGTVTCSELDDEEFKDLNEQEIRYPNSV
jgi:hypothetical protein